MINNIVKYFNSINEHINAYSINDYTKILKSVYENIIQCNIIRKNWKIYLSYDIEELNEEIIHEKIIFEYELLNITNEKISYELTLIQLTDDVNHLYKMYKMDENCNKKLVFNNNDIKLKYKDGNIMKKYEIIELEPNISYFVYMDFEFVHYVSSKKPFIHNSLAPIQPNIGTTIQVTIPQKFKFDLLGKDAIVPDKSENSGKNQVLHYVIPYALYPEQIIEYVVSDT